MLVTAPFAFCILDVELLLRRRRRRRALHSRVDERDAHGFDDGVAAI